MPSYRAELSDAQIESVLDELVARRTGAPPAKNVELVTDPVCHLRVRAEPTGPHATHEGRELFFCSEQCRDAFVAAPARY